jgi:hypothetical protein
MPSDGRTLANPERSVERIEVKVIFSQNMESSLSAERRASSGDWGSDDFRPGLSHCISAPSFTITNRKGLKRKNECGERERQPRRGLFLQHNRNKINGSSPSQLESAVVQYVVRPMR